MTKQISVFLAFTCTLFLLGNSSFHPTNNLGGYTGAPEDSTCKECHNDAQSKGSIQIVGIPDTVLLGRTYSVSVQVKDTENVSARAGFQMLALDASQQSAGNFEIPDGVKNVLIRNASGRKYIGHKPAKAFENNVATFDFMWTAPTNGANNTITFYTASVLGNGANGNKGDQFVSIAKPVFLSDAMTPVHDAEKFATNIYPNPVSETLFLSFETAKTKAVRLYTTDGELVLSQRFSSKSSHINVQDIRSGLYLMDISDDNKRTVKKIIIQH